MNISDPQELIILAKNGDKDAFSVLYENFFTPIFRYIYGKINNKQEAEDLTQVVFLKAFKSIKNFESTNKSPISYFFTIARNTVIDFWRKKKEIEITENEEDQRDFFDNIEAKEDLPNEAYEKKEKYIFVKKLLNKLKLEYKEVLELRFVYDYSTAEIAQKLGKNESNIRQIQVRALRKLKNHLQ